MKQHFETENAYFAASNSANGFCSYYAECFDAPRIGRVYAIKGGPGTGKSFFLRRVADRGREAGWSCESIYCSSDPQSLDGVILSKGDTSIALLDATAPHVYEPHLPGVREELVDLGAFWDASRLSAAREQIELLQKKKSRAWARAYRYLESYGILYTTAEEMIAPYVRKEALRTLAKKWTAHIPKGEGYESRPALQRAFGMRGRVMLPTFFQMAKQAVAVIDCKGCAAYLMQALGETAVEKGCHIRLSRDPLLPDHIDGILFEESGFAVVVVHPKECPEGVRRVDLRRFVRIREARDCKRALLYAERMKRAMLGGAEEALEEAKEHHFALEEIYSLAMDFAKKERFTEEFCAKLFATPCQIGENVVE